MKMQARPKELRRTEVRTILFRHKGCIRAVATDLGVSTQAIYLWLKGRTTSEKIAKAVRATAAQLLDQEKKLNAA